MKHHRDARRRHRPRPQQAGRILNRLFHHAGKVQLVHVAAVGEGKPGLHLGVVFRNRLQHAVGDGPVERHLESTAVVDLDLAAAVAVHRIAHPADPRIERGGAPLHLEREIDLPLRVDPGEGRRREPGQRVEGPGFRQHVRFVGVVVAAIQERLIDEAGESRGLEVGGVGKANAMFTKGAKTDAAAFR